MQVCTVNMDVCVAGAMHMCTFQRFANSINNVSQVTDRCRWRLPSNSRKDALYHFLHSRLHKIVKSLCFQLENAVLAALLKKSSSS